MAEEVVVYPKIYKQINDISKAISPIAKGRKNQAQGYSFRGVDDIMNELSPILSEVGVFILPIVQEVKREERVGNSGKAILETIATFKFRFMSSLDGSFVDAIVIGEGMDSGDKASNKAMSIAYKYACLQVFCVPTEDSKDPEDANPEPQAKTVRPSSKEKAETDLAKAKLQKSIDTLKLWFKKLVDEGKTTKENLIECLTTCNLTSLNDIKTLEQVESVTSFVKEVVLGGQNE
jgi:hypothetical protein